MDHRQIDLVRAWLSGCGEASLLFAAELFHRRLFLLAPELRPFFDEDARSRNEVFLVFVHAVVADLDRLDRVLPRLVSLARTADRAGITAADYEAVRAALFFALRMAMFETFSFSARAAWRSTFDLLAGVMKRAVAAPLAPSAPAARRGPAARSGTHCIVVTRPSSIPPPARAAG